MAQFMEGRWFSTQVYKKNLPEWSPFERILKKEAPMNTFAILLYICIQWVKVDQR